MKKFLALMAVVAVLTSASGCQMFNRVFNRGESCNTCGPQGVTAGAPVDAGGGAYVPAPVVQ